MRLRCLLWSAPVLSLSLLACGGGGEDEGADEVGDTGDTEADGTEEAGETGEEPPPNPFAEVVEQGLGDYVGAIDPSEVVEDGAATHYLFDPADGPMCLRGGDYWMSTRAGSHDPKDLLIYLQGGGACWSELCQAFETLGPPAVPDSGRQRGPVAGAGDHRRSRVQRPDRVRPVPSRAVRGGPGRRARRRGTRPRGSA